MLQLRQAGTIHARLSNLTCAPCMVGNGFRQGTGHLSSLLQWYIGHTRGFLRCCTASQKAIHDPGRKRKSNWRTLSSVWKCLQYCVPTMWPTRSNSGGACGDAGSTYLSRRGGVLGGATAERAATRSRASVSAASACPVALRLAAVTALSVVCSRAPAVGAACDAGATWLVREAKAALARVQVKPSRQTQVAARADT
jgi:hypothetical protein